MRRTKLMLPVAIVLCLGAAPASATAPGENGKIAFTSTAGPSWDIHTIWPDPDPAERHETNLTPNPGDDGEPAWSPDGSKIAYSSQPSQSVPPRIWVMNEDGSGKTQLTPDDSSPARDEYPTWSPDGARIAWIHTDTFAQPICSEIRVMDSDGANPVSLGQAPFCELLQGLDWSADGTKLAYSGFNSEKLFVANADNTGATAITYRARAPSWSPSGNWILFDYVTIRRMTPDGVTGTSSQDLGMQPDWSPDGKMLVRSFRPQGPSDDRVLLVRDEGSYEAGFPPSGFVISDRGVDPDWQSVGKFATPPGYPRPRGAGPIDVSLVPAYEPCDAPNETHGSPLAFGSCSPPVQSSASLTVGTADANGQAPRSVGRATFKPLLGNPSTPADEADVRLIVSVSDVRCRAGGIPGCAAPLGDYTGSLREAFDLTITDRYNGGSDVESATVQTRPYYQPALSIVVPCAETPDPAVGGRCSLDTTAEALLANAIEEGRRSSWAIGRIQLWDAGEDGNLNTDDNTLFATQGLFVP